MFRRTMIAGGAIAAGLLPVRARADALGDGSFARDVARLLAAAHPEWTVAAGDDPLSLRVQGASVFLRNVYLEVQDLPGDRRDAAIVAFVEKGIPAAQDAARDAGPAFDAVRAQLRPQVVPAAYLRAAPDLAGRDFLAGLLVVSVVDEPDRYVPVTGRQLAAWRLPREAVEQAASANLEAASERVPLAPERNRTGGAFLAVATRDGYDAARLLLPRFMGRVRAALGAPSAYACIPNRDFLVAWTPDFASRRQFAAQVAQDAGSRPHPLTSALFVTSDAGVRLASRRELADHGR